MKPSISLITPSYRPDLEACRLLCETVDAYATGHQMHYVVVPSKDVAVFAPLAAPQREIVDAARLLPPSLKPLPSLLQWRGRRYWWAPGILPVFGWHIQQLIKIAITRAQSSERVVFLDSDVCFCRPISISAFAGGSKLPLHVRPACIDESLPDHVRWWRNAHRMLGLGDGKLPGDDYIGPLIVWERRSVETILARIEAATGAPWWVAMCRARDFSEYLIYGAGVAADAELAARHALTTATACHSYWQGPALDQHRFAAFVAEMRTDQVALNIQSFTGTPIELVRRFALGAA